MQPYFKDWIRSEIRRLDDAIVDVRRAVGVAHDAAETAMGAARRDLDRRVEALNEFRAQLAEQQTTLLTRAEYEAKHDSLVARLEQVVTTINDFRQGSALTTGRLFGGLAVVVFLVSIGVGVVIKLLP